MKNQHLAPKKSLGQNFLVDRSVAAKIVAALNISPNDILVEIGPGEGALTGIILEKKPFSLLALEFDGRAVELLSQKFPASRYPNFTIREGDALTFSLKDFAKNWDKTDTASKKGSLSDISSDDLLPKNTEEKTIKVIGNIPYYITADLLFWLFSASEHIEKAVIMMQKEVAQRLTAKPRSKEYGVLTLALAFAGTAKNLFSVAPGSFFPRPAVTSAVVEIRCTADAERRALFATLQPLIREAFSHRRKMLSNALSSYISSRTSMPLAELLARADEEKIPYFRQRAEELSPDDFVRLYEFLEKLRTL